MRRTLVTLATIVVSLPATAAVAQTPQRGIPPASRSAEVGGGPSTLARIASGIGGALLGAGLGFFASQIVRGDWQEDGGTYPIDRTLWTVVGASVGLAAGVGFPVGGRGGVPSLRLPSGRDHLGTQELDALGLVDAYHAVSALRPEWLIIRGSRSLAAGTDPVSVGGSGGATTVTGSTPLISEVGTIQVYVNNVNVGGLEELKSIQASEVQHMYFFDTGAATLRWGGSHPHGAILIVT
ncbi:MAG TPA: hypothetical protein VJ997_10070 [Longimicrobiales bacterium]|nr:hypothetical protein [Longimicrobiales bacterium]